MFDYLQQFNKLPKDLRDRVSSPSVMAVLADLEKKYQVDLAVIIMKVMIKSLNIKDLAFYFIGDLGLTQSSAEALIKELTEKIFINVADYLGLAKEVKALDLDGDINLIIKEAGLVLPSSDLVNRFKSVLSTYLKGIRSKVAARDALAKEVGLGGLGLTALEIDRVFKVCEQKTFKSLEVNLAAISKITTPLIPQSRLDKIISAADGGLSSEYNLKQAIASGQIKKPEILSKLDTSHDLATPKKELDLPLPVKKIDLPLPAKKLEPIKQVAPIKPITPIIPIAPVIPAAPVIPVKPVTPFIPVIPVKPAILVKPIIPRPTPPPLKPIANSRPFDPSITKTSMHDIKAVPKIMGPLEELQFLDLLNFRRLGKTPEEITAKVFSKIKLLEADGYDKMVTGVKAWRQSPVSRLYLKMMQEAISKGTTIKDFALASQKDNKNYLSLEEIEAILVMNSKLIF